MSNYLKWAIIEHRFGTRLAATLPAGIIFVLLLPYVIVTVGPSLDLRLGVQQIDIRPVNIILGGILILVGLFLAWWSILVQFIQGRGTPLPILPTQELLIKGPFRFSRNPMTLGTILAYLGIGVIAQTAAGIGLVLCFAALLVIYLKVFEEQELAERFGEDYLLYRREVPFILPKKPKGP